MCWNLDDWCVTMSYSAAVFRCSVLVCGHAWQFVKNNIWLDASLSLFSDNWSHQTNRKWCLPPPPPQTSRQQIYLNHTNDCWMSAFAETNQLQTGQPPSHLLFSPLKYTIIKIIHIITLWFCGILCSNRLIIIVWAKSVWKFEFKSLPHVLFGVNE